MPEKTLMLETATPTNPESAIQASCMAALISALSRYFGQPRSVDSLKSGLPLAQGIVLFKQLPTVAHRAHLSCHYHECGLEALDYLKLPAVLEMQNQQACILINVNAEELTLLTTAGGKIVVDYDLVAQNYTGRCYTTQPNIDREIKQHSDQPRGHWLWSLAWEQRKVYLEAASGSVIVNLLGLALPLFIMAIYDRIIPNYALESLWVMVSGMLLVAVIDFTLRHLRAYTLDRAGRTVDTYLGNKVFNHVLYTRLKDHRSSGATANTIRELDVLREFLNSATLSLISDVPFLLLFIFMIYFIGGSLAWVPIILLPLLLTFFVLTQFPLYRLTKKAYMNASNRNTVLFEILNGIESVKALGAESWAASRWEKAHAAGVKTAFASRFYGLINQNVMTFAQTLSMLSIITLGVFLIKDGTLSFGALFAAVILNGRVMAPISQIAQIIGRLHAVYMAYHEIDRIMSVPLEHESNMAGNDCPVIQGNLVIDQLAFSYEVTGTASEAQIEVFKHISCHIKAGERVALVGTIGSGKSTLLKLLLNLISPDSGTIRIEGIDSREFDPADLRAQIGYMPQNLHFFSGSIRENITIHRPQAHESEINRAAEMSGVTDWLSTCPLGLAQPVGERGDYLSGGQRQSVALARALLGESQLLLMDEPTSLLDSQSEMKFVAQMQKTLADKTLIVATHRPAMLALVDRIIVLDKGGIALDGPRQEVINTLAGKR